MIKKKYTDEEIRDIKKWRSEGLTWAEISDRNGRTADAMQVKFSTLKRGISEYKEPEIPPVIVPEGVSSINERKAAAETPEQPKKVVTGKGVTVKRRILKKYTVLIDVWLNYENLEDAARIIAEFNKLTEISQGYSGRIKLFEENEIEI